VESSEQDTWLGVPFTEEQMVSMAERNGLEPRHLVGVGEERLWVWLFKR
jgi:hypothetical protein